jgi:hypothetical protein
MTKEKGKKYGKLDALILASIGMQPKPFSAVFVGDVKEECCRIATAADTRKPPFGVEPFRVCDRRLQALRKAGKIVSTTKGWVLP